MPWSPLDYVETRIKIESEGFVAGGFDSEYCHFMTDKQDGDDESIGSDSIQELDPSPPQPNVTKTASVPTEKTITPLTPYVPQQQQPTPSLQQPMQQNLLPTINNPPPPIQQPPMQQNIQTPYTASTFQCKYCDLVCPTFVSLHEHLIIRHQVKLNCNRTKCKKTFNSTEALAKHIKKHDEDRARKQEAKERRKMIELTCKICGKMCTTNYKFRLHMIQHSGNLPFPCSLCDKAFLEKCRLAHHMLVNHPDPNVPKPHGCKYCGKRFTDKSYLKVHERSHTKERPYICEQCGKSFPCRNSLKRHRDCHSEVKKYRCEICGKMFKFITTLSTHRYRKHKNPRQKTEVCKQCGAAFTTRYLLKVHFKTHKIHIPLACDFCGKYFINRKRMATHMKTHLNIRAHVCEICGRDFIGSSTLKQHMLTHTGARPHECHVCHQRFAQITALKTHFKRHPNILPFKCQLCGQSFRLKSEFNTHSESHGNEPIVENLSNSTNQNNQNTFTLAPPCPTFQMSKLQTEFNLQYGPTSHPHNPLPPTLPTMAPQDIQQPNWLLLSTASHEFVGPVIPQLKPGEPWTQATKFTLLNRPEITIEPEIVVKLEPEDPSDNQYDRSNHLFFPEPECILKEEPKTSEKSSSTSSSLTITPVTVGKNKPEPTEKENNKAGKAKSSLIIVPVPLPTASTSTVTTDVTTTQEKTVKSTKANEISKNTATKPTAVVNKLPTTNSNVPIMPWINPKSQLKAAFEQRSEQPSQNSRVYECQYCELDFPTLDATVEHIAKKHPRGYNCNFCNEKFCTEQTLNQHKREKHWRESMEMLNSKRDVSDEPPVKNIQHLRRVPKQGKKFPCTYCRLTFDLDIHLERHVNDRHFEDTRLEQLTKKVAACTTSKFLPRHSHMGIIGPLNSKSRGTSESDSNGSNSEPETSLPYPPMPTLEEIRQGNIPPIPEHLRAKPRRGKRRYQYCCDICGKHFNKADGLKDHKVKDHKLTPKAKA